MTGVVNPKVGFSYVAPTQDVDGNPFPANKITKYQIGLGQVSGTYTLVKDDVTIESGSNQTTPISVASGLAYGQWYAAVRAVTTDGVNSAWSGEIAFVLAAPVPQAPSGFTVS